MVTSGLEIRPHAHFPLDITRSRPCHQQSSRSTCTFWLMALALFVLPGGAAAQPVIEPSEQSLPAPFPPKTLPEHQWLVEAPYQEHTGHVLHLRGHPAQMEDASMLLRADEIDFDGETHDVEARGNVYYHNFEKNEELWCERLEYNTQEVRGKFYNVRGETHPRIASHPGMLTTTAPFHFEGRWAERIGDKYIVYNGWVTNCTLPDPWWKFKGKRFAEPQAARGKQSK